MAEPNWRQLYLSLAEPTDHLTDRSELVIGLRSQTFGLPGLWSDVGQALEVRSKLSTDQIYLSDQKLPLNLDRSKSMNAC